MMRITHGSRRGITLSVFLATGAWGPALVCKAQENTRVAPAPEIHLIQVDEPEGQILSFRHLSSSTLVQMKGTRIEPTASTKMKIQSRRGFVEIDINRGDIKRLQPARRFGQDYLTYVLWAVSVDGKASNLGEITFRQGRPVSINVTTPLQTFWLMVTAEPDFAVNDPSPVVVLYSINQKATETGNKALHVPGNLRYYTYYTRYSTTPAAVDRVTPNELQQARKAVELASKAGILGLPTPQGEDPLPGELRIRATLEQARGYLQQARETFQSGGDTREAVQFARTASNIAENARALAIGAVGGINLRQLERELAKVRGNLADRERELAELRDESTRRNSELAAQIRKLEEDLEQQEGAAAELRTQADRAEADLARLRQESQALREQLQETRTQNAQLREDREKICSELRSQLASLGQLTQQGGNMALTLASDILFDFNSFQLRPTARENLAKLGVIRTLLFPGVAVRYQGHTDRVGDDEYNQWLSEQRALSVDLYFLNEVLEQPLDGDARKSAEEQQQLVKKLLATDFAPSRPGDTRSELLAQLGDTVVGKGETEPVEETDGPSERNRRVVLLFPPAQLGQVTSLCESSSEQ
ncbi:MAG: OmpA family protein [Acidobacteriota bacterium]